jgi:4'-phosphopantetheinyl transferase
VAELQATLSPEERGRIGRARAPDERRRRIVARGALREVLGRATGRPPAAVELVTTALGRPRLRGGEVSFSVAHCGDEALVALAGDRAVGVDLERHRPVAHLLDVARRVLVPEAVAELAALPDERRAEAFFRWWTRTEAQLKARGEGLRGAGRPPDGSWSVRDLPAPPGWSAAIAAAGAGWRVVPLDAPAGLTPARSG